MKKAIITGIRGQDGAFLAKLLLEKGYEVVGSGRCNTEASDWRLRELGIDMEIIYMDLLDSANVVSVIEKVKPDEVYNLAAQSSVRASFVQPLMTADVNAMGVLRILEAIRTVKPDTKFYQASSSEIFGIAQTLPVHEKVSFYPRSPYAVTKLFSHCATINYRESFNMFACSGILFNHESPLRATEFITRKITSSVARISCGLHDKVVLGNLDVQRDWGYAPEYVDAMWRMLQQEQPDDYIIATGETHSVREFVESAFRHVGCEIAWHGSGIEEKGIDRKTGKTLVEISPEFFRPSEVFVLRGDYTKAHERLGWKPRTKFDQLVEVMVEADLKRVAGPAAFLSAAVNYCTNYVGTGWRKQGKKSRLLSRERKPSPAGTALK